MSRPRGSPSLVSSLLPVLGLAASIAPSTAAAQTKPVTVTITQIEQIGDDFDPISLGDFYAHVTIDGQTFSTFDDAFSFDGGFIVPSGPLYPKPAWVLTKQVPFTADFIPVRIELFDDDLVTGAEEANLNPGPGNDLNLVVDMATGRWSGDVNWPQSCVSGGHDLGSKDAAVCFDISVLSESGDADGDGLLDGWEINGFNLTEDGTTDFDLPAFGANPLRKDVFVEVDCLVAPDHSHCPRKESLEDVVAAYARAPVLNLDGTTGVQLHLDVGFLHNAGLLTPIAGPGGVTGNYGNMGGGGDQIGEAGNEVIEGFGGDDRGGTDFSNVQVFDANRSFISRYAIFGHQTNVRKTNNDCTSGQSRGVPGRVFFVTLGGVDSDGDPCHVASVGDRKEQAGTFMHELGHSLGLEHGGDEEVNKKPNYLSVMSYAFQDCEVTPSPNGALPGGCDYSRVLLPPLDERSLDECLGLDGGTLGFGPMDWDGDTLITGQTNCQGIPVNSIADINNDGICVTPGANQENDSTISPDDMTDHESITDGRNRRCNSTAATSPNGDDVQATPVAETPDQPQVLTSFDDWNGLKYSLGDQIRSGSAGDSPQDEPDPQSVFEARNYLAMLLAPRVLLQKTGPATAVPGETVTFTLQITNPGFGPALRAVVTDTQPDGSAASADAGAFVVGSTTTKTSTFTVPLDACPGDFTTATSTVEFQDFVGNPKTATASTAIQILDVSAPTLTVTASPAFLWPPNHKFVDVAVAVAVNDNCDANPAITLVSVTSSEPATGVLGNGDKGPDIQGAAIGTDDRAFQLRSERDTGHGATGRVYTIRYRATDVSGNSSEATTTVVVPANQGS